MLMVRVNKEFGFRRERNKIKKNENAILISTFL